MRKRVWLASAAALFILVGGGFLLWHQQSAASQPEPNPPSKESLVTLPNEAAKNEFVEQHNLKPDDIQQTEVSDTTYIVPLSSDTQVAEDIAPRRQYRALLTPNDPIYPQDYTNKISAPAAWDISTGSSDVTIAVIDTGFALGHEDMENRWHINSGEFGAGKENNGIDDDGNSKIDDWRGWDFAQNDNNPNAGSTNPGSNIADHGTVTSGLIGATGNNGKGVASTNWGASILPLQVLSDEGTGFTDDIVAAVNYAVARGAKVISMSLGSNNPDPTLQTAITNAINAGVAVIAAAGNCGDPNTYILNGCDTVGQIVYPAKYSNVIAVGASTSSDTRVSFSSYGPEVDLLAPGSGAIRSTTWSPANQTTGYTSSASGTSMSTPIVSGTVGLLLSVQTGLTPTEITTTLKFGVDKIAQMGGVNKTDFHGFGRLNSWKSLKFALVTHPDGTLVRADGGSTVYLLENGQRRHVGSPAVFQSQGYQAGKIRVATAADLHLTSASNVYFREGTLLRGSSAPIYAVDYESGTPYKRHITSPIAFTQLGYSEADVINVSDGELPAANGPAISSAATHPDGTLVRASGSSHIYLLESGQRRYVGSPAVLQSHNFNGNKVKTATSGDVALGLASNVYFNEGTLVKDANPAVYVVDNNGGTFQKRHVISPTIFTLLSYTSVSAETHVVPTSALPTANGTPIQ